MRRLLIGHCYEPDVDHGDPPPERFRALREECGVDFVVLRCLWFDCHSAQGVFDFTRLRYQVNAIRDAGMDVFLCVSYPPAWATEGVPTYLPYTKGVLAFNDPNDGKKGTHHRADCDPNDPAHANHDKERRASNPPHVDAQASFEMGAALGEEFGAEIRWYSVINEPGGAEYWPPSWLVGKAWRVLQTESDRPYAERKAQVIGMLEPYRRIAAKEHDGDDLVNFIRHEVMRRYECEVLMPFADGLRDTHWGASLAGIEADRSDVFREFPRLQYKTKLDLVTWHPYPDSSNTLESVRRMAEDEYLPITREEYPGVPILLTETDDADKATGIRAGWKIDLMRYAATIPEVIGVSFYRIDPSEYANFRAIKAEMGATRRRAALPK